jgi:hypothetical protein
VIPVARIIGSKINFLEVLGFELTIKALSVSPIPVLFALVIFQKGIHAFARAALEP